MQQIFLAIFCLLEVEAIYVGCLNISWQVVQKNLSKASWFDISTVLFIIHLCAQKLVACFNHTSKNHILNIPTTASRQIFIRVEIVRYSFQ